MKLIIEDDEGRKTVIPVVRDEITIGRNDANMVRLTEKNVSRKHGRLLREDGHFYIEDLDSFTGIRVNGEKIKGKHLVREGDLIQISEYDLSLQAGPDEKKEEEPKAAGLGDDDDEATLVRKKAQEAVTGPHPKVEDVQAVGPSPQIPKTDPDPEAETKARKNAETATIRLSDLRTADGDAPTQDVPEAQRPKLVGISGTYRGKELVLDRTPIRIGRNEENDVEIDHPSISRKHCRLHLDGGTWKVMDAESRNGVRVNGEPYAAIGLRHNDVLEIGHLRFAFVEPGKPFKLPSEFAPLTAASGQPMPVAKSNTGLFVGIAIAVAAVVGVAIFEVMRHRGGSSDDDGVEVVQGSKAERKFALRSAEESLAGHRYGEALRNLDVARRAGASAAELKDYNAVQGEARAEDLYREMESAASSQDWERSRKLLNVLTSGSTYFGKKAADKAEAITAGYVNLHIAAAGLMKDKDNAGCLSEAELALQANPQSADAQSLVEACKKPQVTQASVVPSARTASPSPRAAAAAQKPADDSEARKLVNDGNQKLIGQDFPAAIALYQKALSLKPSDSVLGGIYRSMGIAFTRQGNIEEGAHYYKLYLPLCTNASEKAQLQKVLDDYEARRR
ncbi:MAG: FHA domain-containing protein [Myxococcales bacterium]